MRISSSMLGIFFLVFPFVAFAQTPYSVSIRSEPFQPLPIGGGTATTHTWSSSDDGSVTINLPFTVKFFDNDRSNLFLSTNVFASWQTTNGWTNVDIPSSGTPNEMMAVWWDDNSCSNPLKTQILGTAPSRTFVAEWNCVRLGGTGNIQAQLWLYEGSSTIEYRYGQFTSTGGITATMGIENASGTVGYGVPSASTGGKCNPNCTEADWHENAVVTFSQGPELRVSQVQSLEEGFAGLPIPLSATVMNVGGKVAEDFTVRFYVSKTPTLTPTSIELVTLDGDLRSLAPQQSTTFETSVRLPITLEEGQWYILAEVDPHRVVPETNRGDNVGAFGPFTIGIRAANLVVQWVDAPDLAAPGDAIELRWSAANAGNLDAAEIHYQVVLNATAGRTPAARPLFTGMIPDLAMGGSWTGSTVVTLPEDVGPGLYYVGIEIDPARKIFEHERADNYDHSNPMVVSHESLVVLTETLPVAHIGGHYNLRLLAVGGDGVHSWSVKPGSVLPPGLHLREEIAANGELATFLTGVPSRVGTFEFVLLAQSGGFVTERAYEFEVEEPSIDLVIATEHLADGSFGFPYRDELEAMGGLPPYTWEVVKGDLPLGVHLRSDGILSGRPEKDGTFHVTVRVRDSAGRQGIKDLELFIASPSSLTCVTRRLEPLAFGEHVQVAVHAAGGDRGQNGYLWTSKGTTWLATEIGEKTEFRQGPPPGLNLDGDGVITGAPQAFGSFVWTLHVKDQSGSEGVDCPIRLDVPRDRGLTVVTQRLPTAVAGRSYRTQLEAAGGDGTLEWAEYGGGRVLEELELHFDATGSLVGTPPLSLLQGESEREFTITVRVTDQANRIGVGVVTLTLKAPGKKEVATQEEEGGCQTGSGEATLWALAVLVLALLRRRR